MTKTSKHLRKQGYVFDEETGVYAVTPDFFKTLLGRVEVEADEFSAPIGTQPVDEEVGINEDGDVTSFWIQQITNCETLLERYRARLGGVEQRLHQLEQRSMAYPVEKLMVAFDEGSMTDAPGQVGPTGDDEPFQSWAGRQIGKLSKIVNEEVLGGMARRISRSEETLTAFRYDDDSEFRKALKDIAECAKAIDAVSEELAGTDKAVASHNERLEALEHKADWIIQMTGAEAYQRLEDRMNRFGSTMDEMGDRVRQDARLLDNEARLSAVYHDEVIANGEPRYTPSQTRAYQAGFAAGRVQTVKTAESERERVTGAAAMRQEAYDRGMAAGVRTALDRAAHDVQAYMRKAFSEATTEAVVRVVRGHKDVEPLQTPQ